jgi:hypothetical protein
MKGIRGKYTMHSKFLVLRPNPGYYKRIAEVCMKRNRIFLVACVALTLAAFFSACKSTPAPAPAPAPETPVKPEAAPVATAPVASVAQTKPVDQALTDLRDKMEALRAEGLKYGLNTYKATEWSEAEAVRKTGLDAYGIDYDIAQGSFAKAIDLYEAIKKNAFDSISVELEADIRAAREEAIRVGAPSYYPEQFALADESADAALAGKDAGNAVAAYDAGQIALMRYRTLTNGMRAVELRTKIERNGFAKYSADDLAKAEDKYAEAASAYGSADAAAYEASAEAVSLFERVNNAGYKVLAEDLSYKVEDVKALCEAIKAPKAAAGEYAAAVAMYDAAYRYAADDQWELAYNSGLDALDGFSALYQDVLLKRNTADAAIAAAKTRQDESTALAKRADELAPLPADAEGYSEELPVIDGDDAQEGTK